MNICHTYGITWRYDFNQTKSGVVTFGETKPIRSQLMKEREWMLGDAVVDELYEYENLGVLKNYVSSFASNVDDNIEKARKKAGMISSSDFKHRETNPIVYAKFWRQACLPSLLFCTEPFTLNASQLIKFECCQQWFLKNIFYVPALAPNSLLLKLFGLNSTEAEIDLQKLMFWERLITDAKMVSAVSSLFSNRLDSLLDANIASRGCSDHHLWFSTQLQPILLSWTMVQRIYFSYIHKLENNREN